MKNMPDSIRRRRVEGRDFTESTKQIQTGFLAQEVEVACKKLGFVFGGLHVPADDNDNYGIAYGSFVPVLVKAVQEQQQIIEQQKNDIDQQKAQVAELTKAVDTLQHK
jgi:hypothetical protein